MTYYEFVQAVEKKVKEEAGESICVQIRTAQMYNGVKRRGILFSEKGSNVSPTIYLEEYYREFLDGGAVGEIAKEILELYRRLRLKESWEAERFTNYRALEDKVIYRLINREANRELLRDIPYVPYLDFAIVFCVLVEAGAYGMASMPVRTEHLRCWQVTKERVYEDACRNTRRLLPSEFRTMCAALEDMTGISDVREEDEGLYILGNELRCFGAAAILYPGQLKAVGEYLGEDYYVLPSSVHETIIVGKSAAPEKLFLKAVVAEINETQVKAEEVLSDRVYYYERARDKLIL